ncbi:MAG: hypothetical protein ACR2MR_07135, partial [Dietzia maris]
RKGGREGVEGKRNERRETSKGTGRRDEVGIRHRDGVIDATPVCVCVRGEQRMVEVGGEERFSLE